MSENWDTADFQARTEQASYEFLKEDLDLCFTFADVTETELAIGDPRGAHQACRKAENGCAAISRLLVHLKDEVRRNEIKRGLQELRSRLDSLKSRLPNLA